MYLGTDKMEVFIFTFVLTCVISYSNAKNEDLETLLIQLNIEFKEMKVKFIDLEQLFAKQRLENEGLKKQLSVLQSENEDFKERLRDLNQRLHKLDVENIKMVIHNNTAERMKIEELNEQDMNKSRHKNDSGPVDVQRLDKESGSLEKNYNGTNCGPQLAAAMKTRRTQLNKTLRKQKLGRQLTEQNQNENIAFSVFVKDDITGLSKGDVIKFDGVMVNDGNGYDVTTGMFTAPRSGLYLFAFIVEDYHDQDLWVILYEDNRIRSQAVAEPYDSHQNIMGGNVVLLHVREGSRIWAAISKGNRVQENWTIFTGILLH